MDTPVDGERELILRVATGLFAGLGYDTTSVEQIAEAAGVRPAAVYGHFTDKRRLYLAVMERAHRVLAAVIEPRSDELREAPPERKAEALHRFVDGYLDLCAEHPEVPQLWAHRWMSDASDIVDLEPRSAQPLTQYAVDGVASVAKPANLDPLFVTYTIIWCVQGFAMSGALDGTGQRRGVEDARMTQRFRAHMHQLLDRALELPSR
ncbi:TetR/AcrR family transcriptional regulator [Nonomuraea purpurea]|uniref:TetR/AcrR family transcriptional regulator n=1 Tax=Nonomuraea purpurea TaxID=1849276 RepID=A0ABV8G5Q0_9ACTN